jgi:hypothetical protein
MNTILIDDFQGQNLDGATADELAEYFEGYTVVDGVRIVGLGDLTTESYGCGDSYMTHTVQLLVVDHH